MTNPSEAGVLAVLDDQHEDFMSAGNYSGEGCRFRDREEEHYREEYSKARATIAEYIAANEEAAVNRAIQAGLGASEWESMLTDRQRAAHAAMLGVVS